MNCFFVLYKCCFTEAFFYLWLFSCYLFFVVSNMLYWCVFFVSLEKVFFFMVIALKLVSVLFSTFPRIHSPCTLGSLSARFFFPFEETPLLCKTASIFLFAGK